MSIYSKTVVVVVCLFITSSSHDTLASAVAVVVVVVVVVVAIYVVDVPSLLALSICLNLDYFRTEDNYQKNIS